MKTSEVLDLKKSG